MTYDAGHACREFVARHTDFVDGFLTDPERRRFEVHVAGCSSCARYHAAVVHGCALVRSLPPIAPSSDFQTRLHRSLHALDLGPAGVDRLSGTSGVAASLAIAALIALAAWGPVLRDTTAPPAAAPEVAASGGRDAADRRAAASHIPGRPAAPPLTGAWSYVAPGGAGWYARPALSLSLAFESVHPLLVLPGPYSPLVIEPPAASGSPAARSVFTSYFAGVD
jgi:anti-sigma factor RsiW